MVSATSPVSWMVDLHIGLCWHWSSIKSMKLSSFSQYIPGEGWGVLWLSSLTVEPNCSYNGPGSTMLLYKGKEWGTNNNYAKGNKWFWCEVQYLINITVTIPRDEPKGKCCSIWRMQLSWCWMLPLATHCHTHFHFHSLNFMLSKFNDLVAKQHNYTNCKTSLLTPKWVWGMSSTRGGRIWGICHPPEEGGYDVKS